MLEKGIKGRKECMVTEENTAVRMGSGTLRVFATPAMLALMEAAAFGSVEAELPDGSGSVGTLVNISHLAATPVGMKVSCETELVEVDGRRLVFQCTAYDETGKIGEGTHERVVIFNDKFQAKADAKLQ